MTLKIDNAIEEIERALAGNKPKYANDIYLNNAIRYLKEIKAPSLTDDQQVVLEWLKEKMTITDIEPIELIWRLRVNSTKEGYRDMPVYKSYRYMTKAGQFQVLAAFAEWGLEEKEAEG